ncbi:ABC transporter permease [Candidatus Saccharibacteria bacterium]|nr:ABC transporter permease [Candidatus Saccharibacteria bacterium]
MKTLDIARRAGRALGQAKIRTFLTALAIAVGAFTLTLSLAAGEGARQYAERLISSNTDPAELFVAIDRKIFGTDTSGFTEPQEYDENARQTGGLTLKQLTEADLTRLRQVDGIESVSPRYNVTPQFVTRAPAEEGGSTEEFKKFTTTVESYNPGLRPELAAGSLGDTSSLPRGAVLIPDSYVQGLGFGSAEQAVGREVVVQLRRAVDLTPERVQEFLREKGPEALNELQPFETRQFRLSIKAVTKKSSTSLIATPTLYVSSADARDMADFTTEGTENYRKYIVANARVEGGRDNPQKVADVKQELIDKGYNVQSAKDAQAVLFQFVNILQGIVAGFAVLAVIASVFGIINTQYISVLERTSQIGLMKALGMRKFDVGSLFRFEAAFIGLLGGAIGIGLALAAGYFGNPLINEALDLGEGVNLLVFQWEPIAVLLAALMLIAVIAGLLPARKAAKLDPIEALRTE